MYLFFYYYNTDIFYGVFYVEFSFTLQVKQGLLPPQFLNTLAASAVLFS